MHRYKRQDSGVPYKSDTPVRSGTRRRRERYKKLLTNKRFDLEKLEEEETNESTVKPVNASVPCLSSAGLTDNRSQPSACVTSAAKASGQQKLSGEAYSTVQVPLISRVLKLDSTPEGGTSWNMEADSTLEEEEEEDDDDDGDDDDHIYSSASTTLNSSASPEIFRTETNTVGIMTFPNEAELLSLHLRVKNSTMMEDSHAESIHTHHPPNLSTILDVSTVLVEPMCEISHHKTPEDEDPPFERKPPTKLSERKPISYRKKVWFQSPVVTMSGKSASIPQKIMDHPMTPTATVLSFNEESLPVSVRLKRPVNMCSEKARVFNFANDSEGEAFCQKMKDRCVKLRNAVFIPFKSGMQAQS